MPGFEPGSRSASKKLTTCLFCVFFSFFQSPQKGIEKTSLKLSLVFLPIRLEKKNQPVIFHPAKPQVSICRMRCLRQLMLTQCQRLFFSYLFYEVDRTSACEPFFFHPCRNLSPPSSFTLKISFSYCFSFIIDLFCLC